MGFLFDKTKTIYLLLIILSIAIFKILINSFIFVNPIKYFFISLLCIFIASFVLSSIEIIKYKKLKNYVDNDCDPERFINETAHIFTKNITNKSKLMIGNDLAYAYFLLGYYDRVFDILNYFHEIMKHRKDKTDIELMILAHRLSIFLFTKDYNNAMECNNKIKNIIYSLNNNKNYEDIKKRFSYMELRLLFINNELENVDELINEVDETKGTNINKVAAMFLLAELYIKKDDTEKAKDYLEKVISLGNQTIYVQKAQTMLAENF